MTLPMPGVPEGLMKLKFARTANSFDDPNTVANFMKETIRNTGPDKPIFEQDLPRSGLNPLGRTMLTMQEHGGRYTHAPYHPELFMGDLTKDQRSTVNEPMVAQMADQHSYRHDRYVKRKLQDVTDVRTEGMVGEKKMLQQVSNGYRDNAARLSGLFSDSVKLGAAGVSLKPGNTIQSMDDYVYQETRTFKNVDDNVSPFYSEGPASAMKTMLNAQYRVTPDGKVNTSSSSNVYKAKNENVDQSQLASDRQGEQETEFKTERGDIQLGLKSQNMETFRNERKNRFRVEVLMNKDSKKNDFVKGMMPPPAPTSFVPKSIITQKNKRQISVKNVRFNVPTKNNRQESLVEHMKGSNDYALTRGSAIPVKDRLAIAKRIEQSHAKHDRSEDSTKLRSVNAKTLTKAFTTRAETFYDQTTKKAMQGSHTALGLPSKPANLVSRGKLSVDKTRFLKERAVANRSMSNVKPSAPAIEDFKFDTDRTVRNNSQALRGGSQRTNVRHEQHREDEESNPVLDSVTPFRSKFGNSSL